MLGGGQTEDRDVSAVRDLTGSIVEFASSFGLGLQHRIKVGPGAKVSQSVLEDVIEAIAGAISEDLGYPELYKWTETTVGPMVEIYKVK